ncbi:MAG: hypothetical protein EOO91_04550 [Pedobacter sp.]|nr:MAG: hypothetical protein EOO91_04550 [Pedobacter sp.]
MKKIQPKFIGNNPNGEDLFEGQAQKKIAVSIKDLITDDTLTQKLIGIEGKWGSGKSNLIKILQDLLKNSHHFYIYDAWGHQEDLQRRTFLEELTNNLIVHELIEEKRWSKRLSNLLSKKQTTKSKSSPKLSTGIILAVGVTILTPLVKVVADLDSDSSFKIVVALSPLFALFIFWFSESYKKGKFLYPNNLFYLYKKKELENKTKTLTLDKEPSMANFSDWMFKLSYSLTGKKLIIVFDNMDRLPPNKVHTLWSSINTFFSDKSFENIWVIIPFDREHINEAFEKGIGKEFIMKTFPIIYKVSQPVLTDWHKFFKNIFFEAFSDFETEEFVDVRTLYDLLNEKITPRSIISFINELVAIKRIVSSEIELRYIALFVLTKDEIELNPISVILEMPFLKRCSNIFLNDNSVQEKISSLFYNVPLSSASQVLLEREINLCIRKDSKEDFKALLKHTHFFDILIKNIHSGNLDVVNTILSLDTLEFDADDKNAENLKEVWFKLNKEFIKTIAVDQYFKKENEILLKRCDPLSRDAQIKYFIKGIKSVDNLFGDNYYKALNLLSITLKSLSVDIDLYLSGILMEPDQYLNYIQEAGEDFAKFKVITDENDLIEFILMKIDANDLVTDNIFYIKNEYNFTKVTDHLKEYIDNSKINSENVRKIYTLLKALTKEKPIPILSDVEIYQIASALAPENEFYNDLVAMRITRGTSFGYSLALLDTPLTAPDEVQILEVTKNIEFYKSYGNLLLMTKTATNELLNRVLINLTSKSVAVRGASSLNVETILPSFTQIVSNSGIAADKLFNRLDAWYRFAVKVIDQDNINAIVSDVFVYETALSCNNTLSKYLMSCFKKSLKGLSAEKWEEEISLDSQFFRSMLFLVKHDKIKVFNPSFYNALKTILIKIGKGDLTINAIPEWDFLKTRLDASKFKSTLKDIRDGFILSYNISTPQFLYFFEMLIKYGALEERAEDVIRRILTPVMNDEESLNILVSNIELIASLVKMVGNEGKDFVELFVEKAKISNSVDVGRFLDLISHR